MKLYLLFFILLISNNNGLALGQTKHVEIVSKKSVTFPSPLKKPTGIITNQLLLQWIKKYPKVKNQQVFLADLYQKHNYKPIWLTSKGMSKLAVQLQQKLLHIEEEGIQARFPYQEQLDAIVKHHFQSSNQVKGESDWLVSAAYIWYAKKVFQGLDTKKIKEMGWLLPRKEISYSKMLDSTLGNPKLLERNDQEVFRQYYKLKAYLKKYRAIQEKGGWKSIPIDSLSLRLQPKDSTAIIAQIRERLTVLGDMNHNSKSAVYDESLEKGMENFKKRNGFISDKFIDARHIKRMNIPVEDYITTIAINMERCRWIEPNLVKAKEFIFINIPSYKLIFKRDDQTELSSSVVVGQNMNKTVIFSGQIERLVFSPYWNIPRNIIKNEIEQAMINDKDYLEKHNMEWNNGYIRQKPGPKNPMGLVKFIFPNSNEIYLHDTPSKNVFISEYLAYSHGCINVNQAHELAFAVLKNDSDWPIERIKEAMNGEKEITCVLKNKIPVHIGYFTALVNDSGEIHFFYDVYQRDAALSQLLTADDVALK